MRRLSCCRFIVESFIPTESDDEGQFKLTNMLQVWDPSICVVMQSSNAMKNTRKVCTWFKSEIGKKMSALDLGVDAKRSNKETSAIARAERANHFNATGTLRKSVQNCKSDVEREEFVSRRKNTWHTRSVMLRVSSVNRFWFLLHSTVDRTVSYLAELQHTQQGSESRNHENSKVHHGT